MSNPFLEGIAKTNIDWAARTKQMQYLEKEKYERKQIRQQKAARFAEVTASPKFNISYIDQRLEKYTEKKVEGIVEMIKNNPDIETDPMAMAKMKKELNSIKNNPMTAEASKFKRDMQHLQKQYQEGNVSQDYYQSMIDQFDYFANRPIEEEDFDPIEGDGRSWNYIPEPKTRTVDEVVRLSSGLGKEQLETIGDFTGGLAEFETLSKPTQNAFNTIATNIMTRSSDVLNFDWNSYKTKRNKLIRQAEEKGQEVKPGEPIGGLPYYEDKEDFLLQTICSTVNKKENLQRIGGGTGAKTQAYNFAANFFHELKNKGYMGVDNNIQHLTNIPVNTGFNLEQLMTSNPYFINNEGKQKTLNGRLQGTPPAGISQSEWTTFMKNSDFKVASYGAAAMHAEKTGDAMNYVQTEEYQKEEIESAPYAIANVDITIDKSEVPEKVLNYFRDRGFSFQPKKKGSGKISIGPSGENIVVMGGDIGFLMNASSLSNAVNFQKSYTGQSNVNKIAYGNQGENLTSRYAGDNVSQENDAYNYF